jgi:hypothetical protein
MALAHGQPARAFSESVMSTWQTLNCANHPDRIAIERCEVCNKPLCAYCLYYTEDGQRLCAEHAELARLAGLKVEEPGTYAEQLLGAQAGVFRKQARGKWADEDSLYKGNSNDLVALIGALVGAVSVSACCGAIYCLPLVGFMLSVVALINSKHAFDPSRTRKLGLVGLLISGVWGVLIAACIVFYGISIRQAFNSFQGPYFWGTYAAGTAPPVSSPTLTLTPAVTSTPGIAANAAFQVETPVPQASPAVEPGRIWR